MSPRSMRQMPLYPHRNPNPLITIVALSSQWPVSRGREGAAFISAITARNIITVRSTESRLRLHSLSTPFTVPVPSNNPRPHSQMDASHELHRAGYTAT
jgi:hypothetical protein